MQQQDARALEVGLDVSQAARPEFTGSGNISIFPVPACVLGDEGAIRWEPGERFHDLFEGRARDLARVTGDRHPAVAWQGGQVTYAELDAWANRAARFLARQGIGSGDRVGLLFERSWLAYAAMLAVSRRGAVFVPLDAEFPADRIRFIVEDAGIVAILVAPELIGCLADVPCVVIDVGHARDRIDAESPARLEPQPGRADDALCYIVYTSGSTGRPKGVAVNHSSICNFVKVAADAYGFQPSDRVYQGMTIAFDFSVEEIWVPLHSGATLVPRPPGAPLLGRDLARFIEANGITALCCVPTLLATIEEDLPGLRFLLVSGEACPRQLVERWHRPGRTFLNVYGPTEATVTATWTRLDPERPVTIGKPLPTYRVLILDETGRMALPQGVAGEIAIAGPGLAEGYINRPDLTGKAFVEDFLGLPNNPSGRLYRTGDRGRITDDGEVEYLGRLDTQVKIRGYRIELSEIESVLMKVPGVAAAVVGTWECAPGVLELVAYYTVAGGQEVGSESLADRLASMLPAFMMPSFFERLDALPMLPSDKVDRKSLPAPTGLRRRGGSRPYVQPESSVENALAQTLSGLIGTEHVSVEDHFFDDLGSNSLTMARFCAALRDTGFADVSMREIYAFPTVRRLAAVLETRSADLPRPKVAAAARQAGYPAFVATGLAQLAFYLVGTFVVGVTVVDGFVWVHFADGPVEAYTRATLFGGGLFLLATILPVLLKWVLIGRWRRGTIAIWSPGYFRFWIVRVLIGSSPMMLFAGSPLFNLYLRIMGARIGRNAVIFTSHIPLCTDLVSIGDNSVVRKDSLLMGYRASGGIIEIGSVTVGSGAFVGEATVLDIGTVVGDGAQLGHSSTLYEGQTVPDGKRYQGSPAQETSVDYLGMPAVPPSIARKIGYTAFQLAALFGASLPLTILLAEFIVTWLFFENNIYANGYEDFHIGPPGLHLDLLLFAAVIYLAFLVLNLVVIYILPRTLGRLIREDRVYRLFGLRYIIYQIVSAGSNSRALNHVFGDSAYIVHFLRLVGYRMPDLVQTGANFGLEQKHDFPHLCEIGTGTIVSDGLSMINARFSNTAFRVSKVTIGPRNYLGNNIFYPAGSATGENVLLATKVAVPLDGEPRHDLGLLGSPCFEIPRTVLRDRQFDHLKSGPEFEWRLRRKAISNAAGILLFVTTRWLFAYFMLVAIGAALTWFRYVEYLIIPGFAVTLPAAAAAWFMFVERASLSFERLQPRFCSMYDEYYWRHERYWKHNASVFIAMFDGTPLKGWMWRWLGVHVGRMLFDDGCTIPERSLVEIGHYCTLNRTSILQGHSQEDGTFKCDRIRLGDRVTIGCNAFVHYGTVIGDGACVEADSFLMKGEVVPEGTVWRGNPAQPLHD